MIKKSIDNVVQNEWTYDLVGNKVTEKDELGKITSNTYDLKGRLVKQINTSNNYEVNYQYDLNNKKARELDNLSKEILYSYDILGNEIEKKSKKQI